MNLVKITILASLLPGLLTARAVQFDDQNPYFSFELGDGGIPGNLNVYNIASDQISSDGSTVTISGDFGPIDGADFEQGFGLFWSGNLEGAISPGEEFDATLNFSVRATGGSLAWNFESDLAGEGMVSTAMTPIALNGQVNQAQIEFETPSSTEPYWNGLGGYLRLDWEGYTPTDTLSINVNSIGISSVPEPDSILLTFVPLSLALILRTNLRCRLMRSQQRRVSAF